MSLLAVAGVLSQRSALVVGVKSIREANGCCVPAGGKGPRQSTITEHVGNKEKRGEGMRLPCIEDFIAQWTDVRK